MEPYAISPICLGKGGDGYVDFKGQVEDKERKAESVRPLIHSPMAATAEPDTGWARSQSPTWAARVHVLGLSLPYQKA